MSVGAEVGVFLAGLLVGSCVGLLVGGNIGFRNACDQAGAEEVDGMCLPADVAFRVKGLKRAQEILVQEQRKGVAK